MDLLKDFGIDGSRTPEQLEGSMMRHRITTDLMDRLEILVTTPVSEIDAEGLRLLLVQRMFTSSVVSAVIQKKLC